MARKTEIASSLSSSSNECLLSYLGFQDNGGCTATLQSQPSHVKDHPTHVEAFKNIASEGTLRTSPDANTFIDATKLEDLKQKGDVLGKVLQADPAFAHSILWGGVLSIHTTGKKSEIKSFAAMDVQYVDSESYGRIMTLIQLGYQQLFPGVQFKRGVYDSNTEIVTQKFNKLMGLKDIVHPTSMTTLNPATGAMMDRATIAAIILHVNLKSTIIKIESLINRGTPKRFEGMTDEEKEIITTALATLYPDKIPYGRSLIKRVAATALVLKAEHFDVGDYITIGPEVLGEIQQRLQLRQGNLEGHQKEILASLK